MSSGVQAEPLAHRRDDPVEYVGFRVDGHAVVLNLSEHQRLTPDRNLDLVNHSPAGFAAACLYTVEQESGRWVTQAEAADVANVTATTIRNHRDVLQQFEIGQWDDRATAAARERAQQSSR